jgi:glycosyltransferase involved in cell wall biosynthesis
MRIAFICGFAWEPKGTVRLRAFPIASELARRGHEVTLFLTPYDNLSYSGKEWWSEGVRIFNVVIPRWRFEFPVVIARLVRSVRSFLPDVLHVFKPKGFAGAAAEVLMATSSIPVVLDCDDWEGWGGWNEVKTYPWAVKQFIDWQERHLIKRAQAVSVASRVLCSRAIGLRGASMGITYVPNCISRHQLGEIEAVRSQDRQHLRAEMNLPNRPIILYVGHYEAADDVVFFAQAGAEAALVSGATLAFVGDGEQLEGLRRFFARRPEIDARFFGQVPYDSYLKLLAASDIAAFPYPDSPIYRAKCSVRIIEFLAMGKAVITTAVGQNPEYIEDGVNGRLCKAGDLAGFAKSLTELLDAEAERARIGENARLRISEAFVWDLKTGEICQGLYRAMLEPGTPKPAVATGPLS